MAQVEFVAMVATVFKKRRLVPVQRPGESFEDARKRLLDPMEDSKSIITLQMEKPKEVGLRWIRRKKT